MFVIVCCIWVALVAYFHYILLFPLSFYISIYFEFVHTASFSCVYDFDSPSASDSEIASHAYSTDFYVENNMTHPPILESALWEPAPLSEDDVHCVLTSGLIDFMPRFYGSIGECPHRHLERFERICSEMKPPHVSDDRIFLKAFLHSVEEAAWG